MSTANPPAKNSISLSRKTVTWSFTVKPRPLYLNPMPWPYRWPVR